MQKKKICLVTNWYPTEENPYQGLFFREQAIALADYYDFIVLHYEYGYSRRREIVELTYVKSEYNITEYKASICFSSINKWIRRIFLGKNDYKELLFGRICEQLRKDNIDIFYSISGQTEAALTARYANYFNKPYVISEHGPFPWVGTLITEDNKDSIEKANLFLAISNDKVRQILMQGIKLPRTRYVGNMVDEEMFTYKDSGNEIKTFIAVGANVFYKNYRMLIDTFNRLTSITDVPFRLIVVGYQANKGYSQDSKELEEMFRSSSFRENITLIPNVPHDKMPELYAKADAFVMTSIQEGQPVSAIEAACCGLPIFATRCGGVEDYTDDSIGRIVGITDADDLAMHLKDYLEGRISFDSEHIRNTVCERFGKKAFVRNMVDAFDGNGD